MRHHAAEKRGGAYRPFLQRVIHQRFHGVERILIFRFIHPETRHIRVCRTERHQVVDVEQYHTVIAEIIRNAERLAKGERRFNAPRCTSSVLRKKVKNSR